MKVGDLIQSKYNPADLGIIKSISQAKMSQKKSCWVWWIEGGYEMNVWLDSIVLYTNKTDIKCP